MVQNEKGGIMLGLVIALTILTTVSLIFSMASLIKVIAMEKSTHSVQFMPIDEEIDKANKDWASSEEAIKKQQKMYQEEIEDEMPEFALTDEDKETFSI